MVRIIADDYGIDVNVNSAIVELLNFGIIQGTGVMVYGPKFCPDMLLTLQSKHSIGLHVDLTQFNRVSLSLTNFVDIFCSVNAQIELFQKAFGRMPDYIDSHQNVHRKIHIFLIFHLCAMMKGISRVRSIVDFYVDGVGYSKKNRLKILLELPLRKQVQGHILRGKKGSLGILGLPLYGLKEVNKLYELPIHPSKALISVQSNLKEVRVKEYQLLIKNYADYSR